MTVRLAAPLPFSVLPGLPLGWCWASTADLFAFVTSGSRGWARYYADSGDIFLRVGNLNHGSIEIELRNVQRIQPPSGPEAERTRVLPGDILISVTADVGMVGLVPQRLGTAYVNQHVAIARPVGSLFRPYLAWYLASESGGQRQFSALQRGATKAGLGLDDLRIVTVPLCPVSEQRRIVERIEELFSKLDAGVAALERVKVGLKRYRAAVLKAAVEGKLTAEWRARYPATEPASQLLQRILAERRRKWEQEQRAKYAASGKEPPKGWQAKYKEPAGPETTELPQLPKGWCWTALSAIADIEGGITKDQKRQRTDSMREVPYLRVANVQRGFLDLQEIKTIMASEDEIQSLSLQSGDILFTEGGDRDKLGRGWVWNGEIEECIHQNHIFRARPNRHFVEPKFISYHGNFFGQKWFTRTGKQTTNLASINKGVLSRFPVPLAPLEEQCQITSEVERRLSIVDEVEAQVEADLKRAARLRQSILQHAFAGRLVPQDPRDEPAEQLLERIRQRRQQATPIVSKRSKGDNGKRSKRLPQRKDPP